MKELWKPISGYVDSYEISNLGRVRSIDRIGWNGKVKHTIKGKVLKLFLSCDRVKYYYVSLCRNSKYKQVSVHRLVALHFIPNPENKRYVGHKDSNPLNNNVENLVWCTAKENEAVKYANGYNQSGKNNPNYNPAHI